jgi:hypothetical protein
MNFRLVRQFVVASMYCRLNSILCLTRRLCLLFLLASMSCVHVGELVSFSEPLPGRFFNARTYCRPVSISVMVVPYLRRLVAGFPTWQPGFDPKSYVICDGQIVLRTVLRFPLRNAKFVCSAGSGFSQRSSVFHRKGCQSPHQWSQLDPVTSPS